MNRDMRKLADVIVQLDNHSLETLAYHLVRRSAERALRLESQIACMDREFADQELWEVSMRGYQHD